MIRGQAVLDFVHDEEGPLQRLAAFFQRHRFGHRQAQPMQRLDRRGIRWRGSVSIRLAGGSRRRISARSTVAAALREARAEPIGLPACAAGNARKPGHLNGLAHPARLAKIARQPCLQLLVHGAVSSNSLKPEGACGPMMSCSSTPVPSRVAVRPRAARRRTPAHAESADRSRSRPPDRRCRSRARSRPCTGHAPIRDACSRCPTCRS